MALQTFNIAYDTGIFPLERHRLQLSACYLILACTGAWPAEVVDNEKTKQFGHLGELFEPEAVEAGLDNGSRLSQVARGRPKALCYEDILLMVVRHPQTGEDVLAMSIKFIHHKGADNKPKPYEVVILRNWQLRRHLCLLYKLRRL